MKKQPARRPTQPGILSRDYFRIRDFEYVQPLYDLAFLLEVGALAGQTEIPKYRTFSLWRAGYSLDGYGTTIDKWLDGTSSDADLDYVPSLRIKEYLDQVQKRGTIPELRAYNSERFARCLRLRSVRGLGPSHIALAASPGARREEWLGKITLSHTLLRDRIAELYDGSNVGPWQSAHLVPPLLRFLHKIEACHGRPLLWSLTGIVDPFEPVTHRVEVFTNAKWSSVAPAIKKALKQERLFRRDSARAAQGIALMHQMGWAFTIQRGQQRLSTKSLPQLAELLDPLALQPRPELLSDLHLHTAWSDGSASVDLMAKAIVASGLKYFAVTDHSRSSKLQGGLTPALWLRQANALTLATPVCPVLHGIEVDILKDGALDLPHSLLAAADIVVASVHSSWTASMNENTSRLFAAIESGHIDILAHPTSAVVGKPGVPDYYRPPAAVDWDAVFEKCAQWRVALELNCFPSRLDLPLSLLSRAIEAGCPISIGSDSHARSHLQNLRFGDAALRRLNARVVLNRLSYEELKRWVEDNRKYRNTLNKTATVYQQPELPFRPETKSNHKITARIQPPQKIPQGSRVVGIDLTAGNKATGLAIVERFSVETCSLTTDEEILDYVRTHKPKIVSIDSPLGLPGGGEFIDPKAGIMRVAEHDLASVGIPAYPSLIDSMEKLTLRGIRLRKAIEAFHNPPRVIESYPGAAQDILSIPRKQKSLELLREGLRRLGLEGPGLKTRSDDEMDAITSAIVGRYHEAGLFEPMGIPKEAQLIVPKIHPLSFDQNPLICLAGKTGAGKSVVARYLSVFYGFTWVRTRNVIRDLLIEDAAIVSENRLWNKRVDPEAITEIDLREFGAVILDKYKQLPLRKHLMKVVKRCTTPVVIDSIRDIVDVDVKALQERPALIWFVDCRDSIIRNRLVGTKKMGEKRVETDSPVDRTAPLIQREASQIIPNSASLEDLRWTVDDALFSAIELVS